MWDSPPKNSESSLADSGICVRDNSDIDWLPSLESQSGSGKFKN